MELLEEIIQGGLERLTWINWRTVIRAAGETVFKIVVTAIFISSLYYVYTVSTNSVPRFNNSNPNSNSDSVKKDNPDTKKEREAEKERGEKIRAEKKAKLSSSLVDREGRERREGDRFPGKYSPDIPLEKELQEFIRRESRKHGVPYILTLAVIEQESRFDKEADSGDSYGLMQINEVHGPREIIIQPKENVKIGCWLLGYLWKEYKDWNKALTAYNCGEAGAYEQYFRHGSISSPYSREVLLRSERFAELLGEPSVLRPQ